MKRLAVLMCVLMTTVVSAQDPQAGFVPVTEVPASEQIPAAPLVLAAYAFVWSAVVFYVVTMWRKLGKVEQELNALSAQLAKKPR
jgi:CcmD family protein